MILNFKNKKGAMLMTVLLITFFFITVFFGLISLNLLRQKLFNQQIAKQQALHIAEAGVNYYRWHLAHNKTDFFDGKGASSSPYVHAFNDPSGLISGTYSLEITPPPNGSTLVKIKSTGWVNNYPDIKRTIEATYGIPSLAHYSFLTNTSAWFGPSEHLQGEVRSNGGLRIDGTNDSIVSSARTTYPCPASHGCSPCRLPCTVSGGNCNCPGVWGSSTGASLFRYPITNLDFSSITSDFLKLKNLATTSNDYYDGTYTYYVILNGTTYSVYRITGMGSNLSQYNDTWSGWTNVKETITSYTDLVPAVNNRTIPSNGVIFFENNIWIQGTLNGKVTIVAAQIGASNSSQYKSIYIKNNITYAARDGNHILGLIAQKDIKVLREAAPFTTSDTIIDGFLLAQYGHVFRNKYRNNSDRIYANSIEVYGGIISYSNWNWTWIDSVNDGYKNTTTIYDTNGTYAPPPLFPTTGEYIFISWDEN